jgi:superfamily I DNA and/or RNA helicase
VWHRALLDGLDPARRGAAATDPAVRRWAEVLRTREGREAAAKWMLGSRHLHAATCVGMARRDYALSRRTFDVALVDEAGKAFGAELLIPAAVARKVVLVGDHNQLPPTVTTEDLDDGIAYRLGLGEVEELLRRNAFHELFEQLPETHKGMLTVQYRMHAHIGDLVSRLFYEGRLESHRRDGSWSLTRQRVVFVDFTDVPGYRNEPCSQSQENRAERQALMAILRRIESRRGAEIRHVLVVCPYEAQRASVVRETAELALGFRIEVSTVDAVQGGEADVVILMMTRSRGAVQFLLDRHRINVALSRARDAVIVLGHRGCLARNDEGPIAELIRHGTQAGTLDLVVPGANTDLRRELGAMVMP